MKWNEMTTAKKALVILGFICGFAYTVLSFLNLLSSLEIPKVFLFPLFAVFFIGTATAQSTKKIATWFYILAAGYIFLTLMSIFF